MTNSNNMGFYACIGISEVDERFKALKDAPCLDYTVVEPLCETMMADVLGVTCTCRVDRDTPAFSMRIAVAGDGELIVALPASFAQLPERMAGRVFLEVCRALGGEKDATPSDMLDRCYSSCASVMGGFPGAHPDESLDEAVQVLRDKGFVPSYSRAYVSDTPMEARFRAVDCACSGIFDCRYLNAVKGRCSNHKQEVETLTWMLIGALGHVVYGDEQSDALVAIAEELYTPLEFELCSNRAFC